MELNNVRPEEILFKKEISSSENSEIFLTVIRRRLCVTKVHHGRGPRKFYECEGELDIHVLESTAYRRLKEQGLCDRGIIPQFYGSMAKFDPKLCEPHLRHFVGDEYPPSAIFIEYIPNLESITLENYTTARADMFIKGLHEIHKALVFHGDLYPRNMHIVKDDPKRVVWIDFDRAGTYDEDTITDRERGFIEEEAAILSEFKSAMEADVKTGNLDKAYLIYCS